MTRLTFQFVPQSYSTIQLEGLEENLDSLSYTSHHSSGRVEIDLEIGNIEADESGNIRFTVNRERINQNVLEDAYELAVETIDDIFDKKERQYQLSLIVENTKFGSERIKYQEELIEFGENRFGMRDPEYTELDDESMKVSFRSASRAVVI